MNGGLVQESDEEGGEHEDYFFVGEEDLEAGEGERDAGLLFRSHCFMRGRTSMFIRNIGVDEKN